MYTILINNDDSVVHSIRERIMRGSSNVNTLQVLVDKDYISKVNNKSFDMRDFTCVLEYRTPISEKYESMVITPSEELYKDRIQYLLPFTTKLTAEAGDLNIKFTFVKLDMDADGQKIELVRPISSSSITILPVARWSDYIADSNLDNIAQIMLTLQSKIEQEGAYAEMIHKTKADSIHIDKENNTLCLDADGKHISNVDLIDLSNTLIDVNEAGTVKVII